jgi:hypothetical protein
MQQRSEETRIRSSSQPSSYFPRAAITPPAWTIFVQRRASARGRSIITSKQAGLFLALLDGWLQTIDNAIEASKDKTVPETFMQITEAFPYIFATAGEGLPMFLEFWLQASRDEKIWQASIAPYRRYHKYLHRYQKGVDEGSFVEVDPELAARMIVSTAMGCCLQSLLDPKGAKWEKVARDSTTHAGQ